MAAAELVQIFLPLADNEGRPFEADAFRTVRQELTERFGGVTAFLQSPAEGMWKTGADSAAHDRVAMFEVMVETVERDWWRDYRSKLEGRFRQDEVVVRALPIRRL